VTDARPGTGEPPGGEPREAADELARYYDLDLLDDPGDLELYLALAARTGGPVLELAAGTGRLAVPLAASGLAVTALDLDPRMLSRAADRWAEHEARPATVGRARSRARPVRGTLDLVEADLVEAGALASVARHLRSDGLAVVDVWLPGPDDLALYDGRLVLEWVRDDPQRAELVAKQGSARYDSATAIVELTTLFDAWPAAGGPVRRVSRTDRLRLLGAGELVRLATDAGLRVETLAGDYSLTPFGTGAERAVFVGALL
jgi:SAM-dependent methyltransferase